MKKIFLSSILLLGLGLIASAQCEKKVTWKASKAIFLDSAGNQDKVEESAITIETSNKEIMIRHGDGPNDVLNGSVTGVSCNWQAAFKKGKSTLKGTFTNPAGESKSATLTIEGKDGKLVIHFALDEWNGRKIEVPVDSFEEEK